MSDINTSGAAFPGFEVLTSEYVEAHGKDCHTLIESEGMQLREYAAIKLKVPNSGTDWLDNMILESLRDDFARQALAGMMTTVAERHPPSEQDMAKMCYSQADAMLKARGEDQT